MLHKLSNSRDECSKGPSSQGQILVHQPLFLPLQQQSYKQQTQLTERGVQEIKHVTLSNFNQGATSSAFHQVHAGADDRQIGLWQTNGTPLASPKTKNIWREETEREIKKKWGQRLRLCSLHPSAPLLMTTRYPLATPSFSATTFAA